MSDKYCPECEEELEFYPEMNGDIELDTGVYVCENKNCGRFDEEVFNSGDFEDV